MYLILQPSVCKDKVECSSKMDFLKDHWYYNENELLKLVELCFDWKSQGEGMRDLIFIGGDIHCGVTTVLTDEESGLQINHFTTSPVTNHVCGKFLKRELKIWLLAVVFLHIKKFSHFKILLFFLL